MTQLTGRTIGQYQLIELMDQSGNTHVYKAFQPSMNRYTAFKVLNPQLAGDSNQVAQFQRQATINASLEGQYILPIYETGEEDGIYFQSARYVEAGSLRDHMDRYYDPQTAQELIEMICKGLETIYAQNLTHGNLHPEKILLDEGNQPLLSDFGVQERNVALSNVYMSPEELRGEPIDQRSDIYSLAVILYEMLTGVQLPPGSVTGVRSKRPDLPIELEKIILKAMAQEPQNRFQSTSEFTKALTAALRPVTPQVATTQSSQTGPTPPPPSVAQPQPKRDTSWLIFLLGGTFVILLIFAGILLFGNVLGGETSPEPPQPPDIEQPTQPPEQPEPTSALPEQLPVVPPEGESPDDGGGDNGAGVGQLCGSIGLGVGVALFALTFRFNKRRNT